MTDGGVTSPPLADEKGKACAEFAGSGAAATEVLSGVKGRGDDTERSDDGESEVSKARYAAAEYWNRRYQRC